MVSEARLFDAAIVLTVVGLVVMLYGVSLSAGAAVNEPMAAGGAVVAVGIGLILVGVLRVEAEAE